MSPAIWAFSAALVTLSPSLARSTDGEATYSLEQLATHKTPEDCWMSFDGEVYDFTAFVKPHDRWLDMRPWCGKDMTFDFRTKGKVWRDHRRGSYILLARFRIGQLDAEGRLRTAILKEQVALSQGAQTTERSSRGPSFWIPLATAGASYLAHKMACRVARGTGKEQHVFLSSKSFRRVWNILLLAASVPSIVFGLALAINLLVPSVRIDADWLTDWHVTGSLVFATIAFIHIAERWRYYIPQKWRRTRRQTVPGTSP